jgi:hypothetical protein
VSGEAKKARDAPRPAHQPLLPSSVRLLPPISQGKQIYPVVCQQPREAED